MREQFEKLPEIADSLSEHVVFVGNKYTTPNPGFYDLVNWLNGAWYAYQEQQKKIDDLTELNRLKTIALQQSINRTSIYVHEKIIALEGKLRSY